MIITCMKCNASFNLDESLLKPTGSKVRCAKCDDIFVAYPPTPATDPDELTEIISDLEAEQETKEVEGAPETEKVTDEALEDLGLDLDLELEPEKAVEDLPSSIEPEELDDIDLTMEIESVESGIGLEDLEDVDISEIEKMLEVEETAEDEGIADQVIEDLDLDLDLGLEPEETAEDVEAEAVFEESDELDLSDIEAMLDEEEPEIEEMAEPEEVELELDMEMEPELDMVPEDVEAVTEPEELEDADISEIEKMLEVEETAEDEGIADQVIEDLDLDLDLGLEPEETAEDVEAEAVFEESDELDLSDIEAMLDEEEPEIEEMAEPEEIELELDIEMEPELDETPEDVEAGVEPEELDEADLSDIEKMLDIEEVTEDEMKDELDGLDLELDLEGEPVDTVLMEDSLADELDIFDKADETAEISMAAEPSKTDEVELAFEIEDSDLLGVEEIAGEDKESFFVETQVLDEVGEEPAEPEAKSKKEIKAAAKAAKKEEKAAAKAAKKEKKAKPVIKKRKRISKPVFALLVLLLIGGGGYGTYVVLDFMNIKVPYISDIDFKNIKIPYVSDIDFKSIGRKIPYIGNYIEPEVPDPAGNLKIDIFAINSKFFKNSKIGDLFVITGKVKNDYPEARNFIRVTSKLYTKGKILAKTETFFCGNILSNNELSKLDLAAMKKRLLNRVGDKKSNMNVKPGKELPFMVVFANLPKNLDEFSVQVAGSS